MLDLEAGGLDGLGVAAAGNRPRDAGSPELDVAPRSLLERSTADDIGHGDSSARAKDTRRLGEHAIFDGREVDYAVGYDDVEAPVLERQVIDPGLDEIDLREAVTVPKPSRLRNLLIREVHTGDSTRVADLERGEEDIRTRARAKSKHHLSGRERREFDVVSHPRERRQRLGRDRVEDVRRASEMQGEGLADLEVELRLLLPRHSPIH